MVCTVVCTEVEDAFVAVEGGGVEWSRVVSRSREFAAGDWSSESQSRAPREAETGKKCFFSTRSNENTKEMLQACMDILVETS